MRKDEVTTQVPVKRRPLRMASAFVALGLLAMLPAANAQSVLADTPVAIYYGDSPLASVLPDGSGGTEFGALAGVAPGPFVMSPDRTRVAWEATSSAGTAAVDVANADGTGVTAVWSGVSAGRPVWKADGSALAFLGQPTANTAGVVIQSISGGSPHFTPSSVLAGQFEPTDWSADGNTLVGVFTATVGCTGVALVNQATQIALLTMATNTVTTLTYDCRENGTLVRDLAPALSPSGLQLAFLHYGATESIDVTNIDGSARHSVFGGQPCCAMPAWSPDGSKIAYYADDGTGRPGIFVMNADGTGVEGIAAADFHPVLLQWGLPGSPPIAPVASISAPSTSDPGPIATVAALSATPSKPTTAGPVTLDATVQVTKGSAVPVGQVKFIDTTGSRLLDAAALVGGSATVTINNLAAGNHAIVVEFEPSDPTAFATSVSPVVDVPVLGAKSVSGAATSANNADSGGGLTITTPYSPGHPLNLGPLELNGNGTALTASTVFGCVSSRYDAIYVTDKRSGNANWSAYISSTDFTDHAADVISGENLGLTGLSVVQAAASVAPPRALQVLDLESGTAVGAPNTGSRGLKNGPHLFASTSGGGDGSAGICGTLTLTAPTSTPPGIYSATLTMTVG